MRLGRRVLLLIVALMAGIAAPAVAAPPGNDPVATASSIPVAGGHLAATNVGATLEASEPQFGDLFSPTGKTVWFNIVPNVSQVWQFDTCDTAGLNTRIDVFTGPAAVTQLTRVGHDDDGCGTFSGPALAYVRLQAGTTYRVRVGTASASDDPADAPGAAFTLNAVPLAAPANDLFANPTPVSLDTSVPFDNRGAGTETGEPTHVTYPGGASVWFTFTPVATGPFLVTCDQADGPVQNIAVYQGSDVTALSTAAGDEGCHVSFGGTAGTTFHVAVDGSVNDADVARGTGTIEIRHGGFAGPLTVDLGSVAAGAIGPPVVVPMTNTTPFDVNLRFDQVVGSGRNDILVTPGTSCRPDLSLAPGGSCEYVVRLAPAQPGNVTADVTRYFAFNPTVFGRTPRTENSGSIELTGTGTAPESAAGDPGTPGAAGATGAAGAAGANGAAGATGATGPRGRAGRDAKVTCKTAKGNGHKITCKVKFSAGRATTARFVRGARIVRAVHAHERHFRISGLRPARYLVLLSRGHRVVATLHLRVS